MLLFLGLLSLLWVLVFLYIVEESTLFNSEVSLQAGFGVDRWVNK